MGWTVARKQGNLMNEITNLIKIESNEHLNMTPEGDFFQVWVEFTWPIHQLTKSEMRVLAAFLKKRYQLSKTLSDLNKLDKVLMRRGTRREIMEELGMTPKYFRVVLSKFRRNGVIRNNRLYLNLIPSLKEEGAGLLIYFDFVNEQRTKVSL